LVGFQQQPVHGLAQHRAGPSRPLLPLCHAVTDDPQFIAVQLHHRLHTGSHHPLTVVLVQQVFLAGGLEQRGGEFGRQVGRIAVSGQGNGQ
jgi:hypothetical protein